MAFPYFYEPGVKPTDPVYTLSDESSKHAVQVLRMRAGSRLVLANGKGDLLTATVAEADKKRCTVQVTEVVHRDAGSRTIRMGISLLKNAGRLEWFLEKATEIGIHEIIPLVCQRTEKQHFRYERMQHILVSAMLQSEQAWLPVLQPPTAFKQVVSDAAAAQKLIAHCEEQTKHNIPSLKLAQDVLLLIGPEGDFTPDEIQLALQSDYLPVTLGTTRLRTETAGVVAAALLANNYNH